MNIRSNVKVTGSHIATSRPGNHVASSRCGYVGAQRDGAARLSRRATTQLRRTVLLKAIEWPAPDALHWVPSHVVCKWTLVNSCITERLYVIATRHSRCAAESLGVGGQWLAEGDSRFPLQCNTVTTMLSRSDPSSAQHQSVYFNH